MTNHAAMSQTIEHYSELLDQAHTLCDYIARFLRESCTTYSRDGWQTSTRHQLQYCSLIGIESFSLCDSCEHGSGDSCMCMIELRLRDDKYNDIEHESLPADLLGAPEHQLEAWCRSFYADEMTAKARETERRAHEQRAEDERQLAEIQQRLGRS